jgi:hypothetical protein
MRPGRIWPSGAFFDLEQTPTTTRGRIEKSFRMSKHDLRARPIYHHKRESIKRG